MTIKAPPIDNRTEAVLKEQTRQLLCDFLSSPPYEWPIDADGGEAGRALTGIFAYYCSLLIDRINRAPDKNFLAFLDLLGNALAPPIPAQAPLTFSLAATAAEGLTVAAGTRVQAEPGEGGGEPLVFETVRDLWLSTFDLVAMRKTSGDGSLERDVTPLILHPLRQVDTIQAVERVIDREESFYFGLYLDPGREFAPNRPVSLYFFIEPDLYDPTRPSMSSAAGKVIWSYSRPGGKDGMERPKWHPLKVEDSTAALTSSGSVQFLVPSDFGVMGRSMSEKELFWISVRNQGSADGLYQPAPLLKGVALNTVMARNTFTIRDEILGSCNGCGGQTFTTFRKPILPGQRLEINERVPGATSGGAEPQCQWIEWQEKTDFHGSLPTDRHYVINRQTGVILFGDGRNGLVPPTGLRNVRMSHYRTGGGEAGNVAAGAIKTPLSGGRYIEKVVNLVPAQGGAESESIVALVERAPKVLRHRNRAVTSEDYEDLAKLASPAVARALCVPLLDLDREPSGIITSLAQEAAGSGKVSVIVVPRSTDIRPLPSQVLLRQVGDFLRACSCATTSLSVVGPLYLSVDIETCIKITSLAFDDRVKRELQALFADFLHPLTGRYGQGWPFGRHPQHSDIHRLIGTVHGIDHVLSLKITLSAAAKPFDCGTGMAADECIKRTGRFLIHSGRHRILTS